MKILFLEFRGFGDAIIKSGFIERISNEDILVDVLAYPPCAEIFKLNKRIRKVYVCQYPRRDMKTDNFRVSIKNIRLIQKEQYDLCIDTSGDFRERVIGKLCCAKQFVSVERIGFPFGRTGLGWLADNNINITAENKNIYQQFDVIFKQLGLDVYELKSAKAKQKKCVGIHPFASAVQRMWDWKKWKELLKWLLSHNFNIVLFCSPMEESTLRERMGSIIEVDDVEINVGTLSHFLEGINKIDLMIGMDSFAVHAAYYMNTPSIMLCGADVKLHMMWKTPLTFAVYDVDATEGLSGISVQMVIAAIMSQYQVNVDNEE